jgi:sugar lactone lactonase YvrE
MSGVPVIEALPGGPRCGLGESPFWHPGEAALWWVDIPGRAVHRWRAEDHRHDHWPLPTEPGCIAPLDGGGVLLAARDGLWRFDPEAGQRTPLLTPPPYEPARERFNDGKADPQGRLWVGTIYEPRDAPQAALYCWAGGQLERREGGITVSNGLAFSPDGRTLYWSDTKAHTVYRLPLQPGSGQLGPREVLARFAEREPGASLQSYGGRPDGAAVDAEGAYWLRLSPQGAVLQDLALPARCPTMPCFGGADLRTLYVTTASAGRPDDELQALPLSGQVLQLRVDVPGLPVNVVLA